MNKMNSVATAIASLTTLDECREANRLVNERFRAIQRTAGAQKVITEGLGVGIQVQFGGRRGSRLTGKILKMNGKTATVEVTHSHVEGSYAERWRVPLASLTRVS